MSEYVEKMHDDLREKLERLCLIRFDPCLHVAEYFAELTRRIDSDAERLIARIQADPSERHVADEKMGAINVKRIELIGILVELEENNIAMLLETKPQDAFLVETLEKRVSDFMIHSSSSSMDDLEECYCQLAVEIIDETEKLEKRIFDSKTIIYSPSKGDYGQLGKLVYISDAFLNKTDTNLLYSAQSDYDIKAHFFKGLNNALVVPQAKTILISRKTLVLRGLHAFLSSRKNAEAKFYCLGQQHSKYISCPVLKSNVAKELVSYRLKAKKNMLHIEGYEGIETSTNLFNLYWSVNCALVVKSLRLKELSANLLPKRAIHLVRLDLFNVHLECFNASLLGDCLCLKQLTLQATFSKEVKFDLNFLKWLRCLQVLTVTLPDSPFDFSALEGLYSLRRLKLCSSATQYGKQFPALSKVSLQQILSPPRLRLLELKYFNIEVIDRETIDQRRGLFYLRLCRNRIGRIEADAFTTTSRRNHKLEFTLEDTVVGSWSEIRFTGFRFLSILNLKNISMPDLPVGIFDGLHHSLKRLDLSRNCIREIRCGVFDQIEKLECLTLDGNPIETIEANAFAHLEKLRVLSIGKCQLTVVNTQMFNGLKNLEELNLNNNKIESIKFFDDERQIDVAEAELNDEEGETAKKHLFNDLTRLKRLDLSGNMLEKLDLNDFFSLQQLAFLNLASNRIIELNNQANTGLLPQLNTLNLNDNRLITIANRALPNTTRKLNVTRNNLEQLDREFFTGFTRLERADLSGNALLSMYIADNVFTMNKSCIVDFDWSENVRFGENTSLSRNLSRPRMQAIRINKPTPSVLRALQSFCQKYESETEQDERYPQAAFLRECAILTLRRNPDWQNSPEKPEQGHFNLNWLPNLINLSELDFSRNLIESLDDSSLFSGIVGLHKINLSHNRLSRINRDIFKGLPCLKTIDLSDNHLNNAELGLFRGVERLEEINLSSNNISCLNLSRLFRICTELRSLKLGDNKLDERSTAEPIDGKSTLGLKHLDLANNRLEKMDFVRDMTSLRHLDLRGNRIESLIANEENLLGRLKWLHHLDLSRNRIRSLRDEMFAHIRDQLEHFDLSENPLVIQFEREST